MQDGISPRRLAFNRWFLSLLSKSVEFTLRHWLLVANLVNGVIWLGAVAVPLMMAIGPPHLGAALFSAYHLICQQNPDHSYFLLGYQMAMDQRMMAIYASMLLAGVVYWMMGRRLGSLHWRYYGLAIIPIAVDGFTQLFGWRTSNWELRSITGTLFGVATAWLMYPYLDEVAREILASTGRSSDNQEARLAGNG